MSEQKSTPEGIPGEYEPVRGRQVFFPAPGYTNEHGRTAEQMREDFADDARSGRHRW